MPPPALAGLVTDPVPSTVLSLKAFWNTTVPAADATGADTACVTPTSRHTVVSSAVERTPRLLRMCAVPLRRAAPKPHDREDQQCYAGEDGQQVQREDDDPDGRGLPGAVGVGERHGGMADAQHRRLPRRPDVALRVA